MLLVFSGLLPLALALLLRVIPDRRVREACAVAFSFLVSGLIGYVLFMGGDQRAELFRLTDDFVCALRLDGAGKLYIGLAALLWPFAVLYAVEYMRHEEREGNFFFWYQAACSAAVFLAAAENLFTLYIFYELLTLCTVPLVWHKRDGESTRAALAYMLYLIGGAALGFLAVALIPKAGGGTGVFSLPADLSLAGSGGDPVLFHANPYMPWIAVLGFFGFGVKAAVLPFCRWLPKASAAPTPVTALLHAVAVVNAGVFAVLRVLYFEIPQLQIAGHWTQEVMTAVSAATLLYAAVMAIREQQVKRRLAWSTVSNLSYMLLGLSLLSQEGMTAGLSHMIFHSLAKIILFFCAGAVLTQTGRTQLRQMHGLGRKMPFTFGAFTLAGLSLVGVPPFPGFVSKYALVTAALKKGGTVPAVGAVALVLASVLTVIYIFTVIIPAFFLEYREEPGETLPKDPGPCMKVSLAALSAFLIAASVLADPVLRFLQSLSGGGSV